jgi:NitT/TauT family transport system ATP-binding protein
LAADPEVLLLDEPFSGLDAQTRETMQAELLKIWDERKKTAIFVTHQIDEAVYLADRVIAFGARPARIVKEWQIPFERPRSLELKHSPEHRKFEDEIWQVLRQGATTAEHASQ